uniref:Thioredoxin domain-containing protein n=1 Tax=Haptolina brevifila TaxID=156173 RepID=A0A7S2DBN4_9EUKA
MPMLVDFDEDPYWGKRADKIHFVRMHALLFLSPPHAELAGVVRAAATRFERGTMIVMQFMVSDMDTSSKPLLTRYGVNSVLDTPRLVFLDMRKDTKENRQLVYKAPIITEQGIVDFLQGVGLEALDGMATAVKDEL